MTLLAPSEIIAAKEASRDGDEVCRYDVWILNHTPFYHKRILWVDGRARVTVLKFTTSEHSLTELTWH